MDVVPTLLCFVAVASCVHSAAIIQQSQSMVERPGNPASLECSLEGQSNPNFYWKPEMEICGVWCVAMFLLGAGHSDGRIIQKQSLALENGARAQLDCEQTDGHPRMFWYRNHRC
ncbi:hypothetical protein Y1Q_0015246 [Alligator mississippiensis]|uniref:Ig-like domain-containing protein n=1 Tax=Alligator mississippiensis TaxID=8496 RepID=A0A151NL32_ALLMI|nr:hypothetical protein Y1Q_0015246 [Alligator mississippiensis]